MKSKLGLVLEGGGAKGSYHLGAYKALHELGYKFDGIAGTSIGAVNGALIAQGDWEKTYDMWYNATNHLVYGVDESILNDIEATANVAKEVIKGRGIGTQNMRELFYTILDENKLRESKVDLGIVTVKYPSFKTIELFADEINEGDMLSYLMASANFPLFQREQNSDGQFIDGGLKNNLPLNILPTRGINNLIAIRTFGVGVTKNYSNPEVNITYIEPSKSLGSTLDFQTDRSRANLILGYFDTYRTLKGYIGRDFCIKPLTEDLSYISELLELADDKIIKAAEVMGYKQINPKRFMFEKLLPQIADYLELGLETSYEVVIISFFEEVARTLNMDRDKIYDAKEFVKTVRTLFFREHTTYHKYRSLPKIIQSSQFLSYFVKNDFFNFIMDIFFRKSS